MSFSSEQKEEIMTEPIKQLCCRRAFLEGVLASRAYVSEGNVVLPLDGEDTIAFIGELIEDVYSRTAELLSPSKGGRRKLMVFRSRSAEGYLTGLSSGISFSEKCRSCLSEFLRGVFLASGRVSDPAKQYSLEFSLGDRAEHFLSFLEGIGLVPRLAKRAGERVIYFRNSSYIEDFFALANMTSAAFDIMNAKIQSEFRNNANRIANCETNNIDRAVSASIKQISLIEELSARGLISLLPDELERTARLRMEYRDMSLSQLSGIITPPISKSGLSHRLKKITEMAEAILKDKT